MQIPRALIANYTKSINALSASARAGITNAMAAFEFSSDIAADRERIIALMDMLLLPYVDNVRQLSLAFYNMLRTMSLGEPTAVKVAVAEVRDPEATHGAVRAFMQKAVDGDAAAIPMLLAGRVDYELKRAAAETVYAAGRKDKARVRYARVPTGAETCDFCLMLASRGFVYRSEETADGGHYHANCDCRAVPSFAKDTVEGYDTEALYEEYRARKDEKDAKWLEERRQQAAGK